MTSADWIRALAVTALMASACSSAPAVGNVPSPSASPSAGSSPVASSLPPADLALVTLRGSSSYLVRDLTDISHPKTVSNLGAISAPVFVNGTEISYAVDSNLYRAPLAGTPVSLVTSKGGAGVWNSDGSAVLYTTAFDPSTTSVHQLRAGQDQILGSVHGGGVGGCETISSCQIANFLDFRLLYSPDGTMVSLVTTGFTGSSFRVWSSTGILATSSDAQASTFSEWSGTSLYFRDANGVEVWHEGVVSPFLPGVAWIKPRASSAAGQIVYTARDSNGWGHVYVVDTTTRKVRELKSARSDAVFLTSRYVWYQGERACVASDVCGARPPFHPLSGKTYIYDLQAGTETESIITSVSDVWPHPA